MKTTALYLFFICALAGQGNAQVDRLITEIKASPTIQCYYLGQAGKPSELFMKADTLNVLLSMKEKIELFSDSNRVLKYYCFYNILTENDSIGFELLKQVIHDSTRVVFYCSCSIHDYSFNSLLVEQYSTFIHAKYMYGAPTVLGGDKKVFMFPKADKKKYKEKRKQLLLLIDTAVNKEELLGHTCSD